jgi:hypothetical protein
MSSPVASVAAPVEVIVDGGTDAAPLAEVVDAASPLRPVGPFELPFVGKRKVYLAVPPDARGQHRILVNLHGVCNPPGYACGYWVNAGTAQGFMICPEGNTTCGAGGPSSWDESFADMDRDLEAAIAAVDAAYPGELTRRGAILTAFSRGAYAAPVIASMHPGRWPYLILAEADVTLGAYVLRKAGVKAVVLLAGEYGTQIKGERETIARLQAEHFPARFLTMKKAGHYYSEDIDALMAEAIAFVLAQGEEGADAAP